MTFSLAALSHGLVWIFHNFGLLAQVEVRNEIAKSTVAVHRIQTGKGLNAILRGFF
ncbi:MAG: hypothetical protein ACFB16_15960 [Phormidesmis sp.]